MVFMKQGSPRMISMLLVMTMFFTSVLGLTGCKKEETVRETSVKMQESESETEAEKNTDTLVKNLNNIYESEIEMGESMTMKLYLKIDKKGNFIFSRSTDFSSNEKGAGNVYKTEDGIYYMEYSIVNGETVKKNAYQSTFELGKAGEIIFTSPMWFGTTSPSWEKDGKTVYPTFVISKEKETKASEKKSETEKNGDASYFKAGTYGGTYQTTAMGSTLTYSCTLTFSASGTYTYNVQFYIMGEAHSESESGTYKQNGTTITMTSNSGSVTTARVTASGLALTRNLSSFSFFEVTVALTYGYAPGLMTNGSTSNNGNNSNSGNNNNNNNGNADDSGDNKPNIDENVTELIGGTYAVDISWSPMGSYFSPILSINKDAMTFFIYNKTAPNVSKGTGTITEKNGVYTLNYDNGNQTTFTFAGGVITFTSPVWYGTASFNSAGDDGVFVPYTAKIVTVDGNVPDSGNDKETKPDSGNDKETEPDTKPDTKPEPDNKPEVTYYTLSAGNYEGVYMTIAMGSTVNYNCKLVLNADGTYTYQVSFTAMGSTLTQDETGTYTVDKNVLTLTTNTPNSSKEDAGTNTATLTADNVFVLKRYVSSMASSKVEVIYREAQNQTPEVPDQGGSDKDDNGNNSGSNDNNNGSNDNNNGNNDNDNSNGEVSATLTSGDYVVDLSWTEMSAYFTPVLSVNAAEMTFNLYNQGKPETSKGSGTITMAENVYTLTYSNGNTTTFTYKNGVITFTSVLYYGAASLNRTEDNETFIPYTATKTTSDNDSENKPAAEALTSGDYTVDISWSPMAAMFSPILSVDATAMTFNVFNKTAPETSKGSGTITVAENVYTLTYSNGKTTTFTYKNGVITFTSALHYGNASFSNVDADNVFTPYTATKTTSDNSEEAGGTDTVYQVASGTYSGMYTAGVGIEYYYTLSLNADGTYSYNVQFNAGGDVTDNQAETGTYVIQNNTLTLTPVQSEINKDTNICGTITGENTFNLTRHVSSYSSAASEISFTAGTSTATASLEINRADEKTKAIAETETAEETEDFEECEAFETAEATEETDETKETEVSEEAETEAVKEKETAEETETVEDAGAF